MNYLIYGNSYMLIENEIKKINDTNNTITYFLDETDFKEILEDISYNGLFEEKKCVIIKRAELLFKTDKEEKDIEALTNYLKSPNKNITLILVSSEKPNSRSKANKELLSYFNVIETRIYTKSYELAKDFDVIIRKDGYVISQNDLNTFINKCASNYDIAVMEFEKYKKIKKPGIISSKDIDENISNYNMDDFFAFKDAVINKEIEKALTILEDLEASKCACLPLAVMLAKEYMTLYDIKYLSMQKLTNDEISKKLGNMHPFRVKTLRSSSAKYSLDEIEKDIDFLSNLDYKLVSQDNLGIDELRTFLLEL